LKKTVRWGYRGSISTEISDGASTLYDEKKHLTVIESEMNRSTAYVFTNPNNPHPARAGIVTVLFL